MDAIQDWAYYLFHSSAPLLPYVRKLYSLTSSIQPYVITLVDRVAQKPDLATIALLLIILFVSLKILNVLWQAVLFWVRLAQTVFFWASLGLLVLWAYNRGPDGMMQDIQYWTDVWIAEYHSFKQQERVARGMARQRPVQGSGARTPW